MQLGGHARALRQQPALDSKVQSSGSECDAPAEGPQALVFYIGGRSSPTLLATKLGTPMKLDKVEVLAKFQVKQSGTWVPTAQKTSPLLG
jgi:hypothetical protein